MQDSVADGTPLPQERTLPAGLLPARLTPGSRITGNLKTTCSISASDVILDQNWYGRPQQRTGADDLRRKCSCSHRWVSSRMARQTNGLPQSGFVDDRRRCRVRGSSRVRMVDQRRHAPSASRWNVALGTRGFPSCLLATSIRRTLHLCEVHSPCCARRAQVKIRRPRFDSLRLLDYQQLASFNRRMRA